MAFSHSDLYAEIKELIQPEIEAERVVNAAWVVPLMLHKHPAPRTWRGDNADAWRICFREHVKDLARAIVREFKITETQTDRRQLVLPGFKFVQRSYQIEREGEPTVVPIDQMTDVEIQEKARELLRMARGCRAHAAELRRYVRDRRAGGAAA